MSLKKSNYTPLKSLLELKQIPTTLKNAKPIQLSKKPIHPSAGHYFYG
jgi:hypothetical protein